VEETQVRKRVPRSLPGSVTHPYAEDYLALVLPISCLTPQLSCGYENICFHTPQLQAGYKFTQPCDTNRQNQNRVLKLEGIKFRHSDEA
jgi:hypothetical protein